MALFAIWHEDGAPSGKAERLHADLLDAAPIVPETVARTAVATARGRWRLSSFGCANHFYTAEAQIWIDADGGACVIHGLIWRFDAGGATLLDARAVARLLPQPGCALPADVAGEYALARIHNCGTVEAFGDAAGLHQIFHRSDGSPILANRAAFVAQIADDHRPDPGAALWLGAIGYRVGEASAWADVRQLPQGARLTQLPSGARITDPERRLPPNRGYDRGGTALLQEGLAQAKAAIRLAAGRDPLDLPITGGKDSRAVLAIALAAGLRDRLTLFTRGYAGHPDVVVGAQIAARLGLTHRREPPLGADAPPDLSPRAFLRQMAVIAWQTDGGMGGWDNVSAHRVGRETLVSGHLGEVLKAYAKRPLERAGDPVEMIRAQGPFDPMDVLLPRARADLVGQLEAQISEARVAGAEDADLPDLFYWQNRVPNWLGGIRGIKSFERQPVLPLGVPALLRLAFQMTAVDRKAERGHFELIRAAAPELVDLPFAHQTWDASLGATPIPPVLAPPGATLFGSWQWSINRVPEVRAALSALFAGTDIPLWEHVDRGALITALRGRRFDYFDGISLLGFTVASIHQARLGLPQRLGGDDPGDAAIDRFITTTSRSVIGHLDAVGGVAVGPDATIPGEDGAGDITLDGWLRIPEWPGAAAVVEARADGQVVATTAADRPRADLVQAGLDHGAYGFRLTVPTQALVGAEELVLALPGSELGPEGGRLAIRSAAGAPGGGGA